MPPKSTKPRQSADETHALKLSALHRYFLDSCAPHTLKDLEKTPPSTTPKIRGGEVKELLGTLVADDLVRCEKIGTGNWYWSFASDAAKAKKKALATARAEHEKLKQSIEKLETAIRERARALYGGDDADGGDTNSDDTNKQNTNGANPITKPNKAARTTKLLQDRATLVEENAALSVKIQANARSGSAADIRRKQKELPELRAKVERWEDNMAILEAYVVKMNGGDRSVLLEVRRALYGEEGLQDDDGDDDDEGEEESAAKRVKTEHVE